jgi:hypothetical protein
MMSSVTVPNSILQLSNVNDDSRYTKLEQERKNEGRFCLEASSPYNQRERKLGTGTGALGGRRRLASDILGVRDEQHIGEAQGRCKCYSILLIES